MCGAVRRTEKDVRRAVERMKRFMGSPASHCDEICLRDFPAHSSGRGERVMGWSDLRTSVNGSSWDKISSKRDAITVYWVDNFTFREDVLAWWGAYSPD